MAQFWADFSGVNYYRAYLNVDPNGAWNLQVERRGGSSGYYSGAAHNWSVNINGQQWSGTWTYDFRPGVGTILTVASGSFARPAVGANWGVSASVNMTTVGTASPSGSLYVNGTASAPNAPGNLRVENVQARGFGVRYDRGSNNGAGIEQDNFRWVRTRDGYLHWDDYGPSGYSAPFGIIDLDSATEYQVYGRSRNAVGWGGFSGSVYQTTLPAKASTPSLSSTSPVVADVSWGGASGAITGYDVQLSPVSDFSSGVLSQSVSATNATFTGLTPGTVFYGRVRAKSAGGAGEWSDTATVRTLSGARRFNGTQWQNCRARRWDGTQWRDVRIRRWNGTTWQNTR